MPKVVFHKFEAPSAAMDMALPAGYFEPIIIDFSRRRAKRPSVFLAYLPWALMMLAGFSAVGLTGFLTLNALKPAEEKSVVERAMVRAEDPTLPVLPKTALDPKAVDLLPILKRLPVGKKIEADARAAAEKEMAMAAVPMSTLEPIAVPVPEPSRASDISIAVVHDQVQSHFAQLVNAAAQDAAAGRNESAIRLYHEALSINPGDSDTAYNLAALLLQKASYFDGHGAWDEAARLYEQALHVWAANDDMGRSIRARLDWVREKQGRANVVLEN